MIGVRQLTKRYGSKVAVDWLSFDVRRWRHRTAWKGFADLTIRGLATHPASESP
jgi:hypothetical protein